MQTLKLTEPDDSQEITHTSGGDAPSTQAPSVEDQIEMGREFMRDFRETFLTLAQ